MKMNIEIPDESGHNLKVIAAIEDDKAKLWVEALVIKSIKERIEDYELEKLTGIKRRN